jgi:lipid kinase YegS
MNGSAEGTRAASSRVRRHLRLVLHGKAAARPEIRRAVETIRADGHRIDVRVTWEAGDSALYAKEAAAQGVDTVVAGGGDGTLNEVVSGVVDGAGPVACSLALLPLGTANDFARGCGIPVDDPTAALRLATEIAARPIDLCQINGRVFANMATGGFGTRVTVETDPNLKKWLGGVSYLLTGLQKFSQFGSEQGRFQGPGFEWEGRFVAAAVGNGRQAGGGIQLCPEARIDDGLLDLVILPEVPQERIAEKLSGLVSEGRAAIEREAVSARLPWLEVDVPTGLHVNLDGEPIRDTRFRFDTHRHWLRFHLPVGSPVASASRT